VSFPPILTTKSDPTAFGRLPLNLTDSEAVPRETKFPASRLKPPLASSPALQELSLHRKKDEERDQKHFTEVDALKCENENLKATIADQAAELEYHRSKG